MTVLELGLVQVEVDEIVPSSTLFNVMILEMPKLEI